jgi:hypothetical protein
VDSGDKVRYHVGEPGLGLGPLVSHLLVVFSYLGSHRAAEPGRIGGNFGFLLRF